MVFTDELGMSSCSEQIKCVGRSTIDYYVGMKTGNKAMAAQTEEVAIRGKIEQDWVVATGAKKMHGCHVRLSGLALSRSC